MVILTIYITFYYLKIKIKETSISSENTIRVKNNILKNQYKTIQNGSKCRLGKGKTHCRYFYIRLPEFLFTPKVSPHASAYYC